MLDIDDDEALPELADPETPPGPDGPTRVTIELECALTDAEVQDRGEQMAADEREIDRLKTRRKALNAAIRGKLDHMTVCALAIDTRKEVRDVPCTWRPDYQKKIWELVRDDTSRVHRVKPMSALDLQTRLPLESHSEQQAGTDAEDAAGGDDDGDDDGDPAYLDDPLDPPFGVGTEARLLPTDDAVPAPDAQVIRMPGRVRDASPTTPTTPARKRSKKNARKKAR